MTTRPQLERTAPPIDPGDLVRRLSDTGFYPDRPADVVHLETHISHVFLAGPFAYKLKKPVRFEFLDFSTVALRHAACQEELRLNRRLSPSVYLAVAPITLDERRELRLGGEGAVVDWLVQMRRLPADSSLDVLLRERRTTPAACEELIVRLAAFFAESPPVALDGEQYRLAIERHVAANRVELLAASHHFTPALIRRVHAGQLRLVRLWPELLRERCRAGRIVEGHGDLRPEHIYFIPEPVVIDCIEFNREFRTLDVADELTFLAMECEMLGEGELAPAILERYQQQTGDAPAMLLLDFYAAYRACVRAKVVSLRAEQVVHRQREELLAVARRYLALAERHARRLGPPAIVLVRGVSGSGKSTLAKAVADALGGELLSTDVIRQTLFGAGAGQDRFDQGRYRPENRDRVYAELHRLAEPAAVGGTTIILDGTYLRRSQREAVRAIARRCDAVMLDVLCECPEEVAGQRIAARARAGHTPSAARSDFPALQRQQQEPDSADVGTLVVDTSGGIDQVLRQVWSALRRACFPESNGLSGGGPTPPPGPGL